MRLRDTQERFWQLITAPEGVEKGLGQLGIRPADLEAIICSDERRTAVERLDIYANMYFWRILDVLRDLYPRTVVVLGDGAFHNLVTDYLLAYPSSHPSLSRVGARLPRFLRERPDPERPWLADLAELELARNEVFDLKDSEPLTIDVLRELPPERFASLELPLIPACRVLRLGWAADDAWDRAEPPEGEGASTANAREIEWPEEGGRVIMVWRGGFSVDDIYHRALDEREADAVALLEKGTTFGLVCEWLARALPEDEAPQAAFALLAQWAQDGVIRSTL